MRFGFHIAKKSQQTLKTLKTFDKRLEAVQRKIVYEAAKQVERGILRRLPKGPEYKFLRKSVRTERVAGTNNYVVWMKPLGRAAKKEELEQSLLYVVHKASMRAPKSPVTQVLVEHSPWTIDTLPIRPPAGTAQVVQRTASAKVLERVRRARKDEKPQWSRKLRKAGAKPERLGLGGFKVTVDVGKQSVDLEFGLAGVSKPHWRPSILKLMKGGGVQPILNGDRVQQALRDPKFEGYKNWTPRGKTTKPAMARRFRFFEKKLGIGAEG